MFDYKLFIANTFVKWFKGLGFAERFRFWCLYWAYALTNSHIRHQEWRFVLDYLPSLGDWQVVTVLDVGCSRSLFCHEVVSRGYFLTGIDLEVPSFKYPATYIQHDIRNILRRGTFDFVTCISVFEHIEGDAGQQDAMNNMVKCLKIGGRLLLTIPTNQFAQGHPWHGFSHKDIEHLLFNNGESFTTGRIIEYTERAGQLCLAIERIA